MESSVHTLCSMKLLGSLYEMDCSHRPSEFPVGQIPSPYSQAEDSKSVTSQTPQGQGSGLLSSLTSNSSTFASRNVFL